MKRIDSDQHSSGLFQDENLPTTAGTLIDAEWLNDVQETLVQPILLAGLTLDGADDTQLDRAIKFNGRRASALLWQELADSGTEHLRAIATIDTPLASQRAIIAADGGKLFSIIPSSAAVSTAVTGSGIDYKAADYYPAGDMMAVVGDNAGTPHLQKGTSLGTSWAASAAVSGMATLNAIACARNHSASGDRWILAGTVTGGNGGFRTGNNDLSTLGTAYDTTDTDDILGAACDDKASASYVMCGTGGLLLHGTIPAVTPNIRTSGTTNTLHCAAWSSALKTWIVAGDDVILTSSDGVTWSSMTTPQSSVTWLAIDASSEVIVLTGTIAGPLQVVYVGFPGNWKRAHMIGTSDTFRGVRLFGNTRYLACGLNGKIYASQAF